MSSMTQMLQGLFFATALACASIASADESPAPVSDAAADEQVSLADLEALAGGDGVDVTVIAQQTLTAINTGNVVSGRTIGSGGIDIGANAFSGFDGVGNFVFNTGHNNNLQSSMNVTVVLAP